MRGAQGAEHLVDELGGCNGPVGHGERQCARRHACIQGGLHDGVVSPLRSVLGQSLVCGWKAGVICRARPPSQALGEGLPVLLGEGAVVLVAMVVERRGGVRRERRLQIRDSALKLRVAKCGAAHAELEELTVGERAMVGHQASFVHRVPPHDLVHAQEEGSRAIVTHGHAVPVTQGLDPSHAVSVTGVQLRLEHLGTETEQGVHAVRGALENLFGQCWRHEHGSSSAHLAGIRGSSHRRGELEHWPRMPVAVGANHVVVGVDMAVVGTAEHVGVHHDGQRALDAVPEAHHHEVVERCGVSNVGRVESGVVAHVDVVIVAVDTEHDHGRGVNGHVDEGSSGVSAVSAGAGAHGA